MREEAGGETAEAEEALPVEDAAPEIRKHVSAFSQASIDEALSHVPDGHDTAVVLYADADAEEMRLGVVFKLGEQWSFGGDLARSWDGPWSVHGELRFSR